MRVCNGRKEPIMDLRLFFRKLEETEQMIETDHLVITSLATPDGGKEGVTREVNRKVAAQLIVEGRARRATDSECAQYRTAVERAIATAEQERLASKVQVTVVADPDERGIRNPSRPQRG
jgi:hypothetical protein